MKAITRDNLVIGIAVFVLLISPMVSGTAMLVLGGAGLLAMLAVTLLGPRGERGKKVISTVIGILVAGIVLVMLLHRFL